MEVDVDRRRTARWIAPAAVLCAYGLLLAVTASADPGDTRDYANSIVHRFSGDDLFFWESGHLLWRPLGYLVVLLAHPAHAEISRATLYADVVHTLTTISILMGAVALLAFLAFLRRMQLRAIPAAGATIAMALSCAFLNYAQTGTAYIPSLAMLIVALWSLAVGDERPASHGIAPAIAFAASVVFWLPMMFVVPVAAASQIILRGDGRRRRIAAVGACVLSGALVLAAYISVALVEHIHSLSGFRAWLTVASHGVHDSGGVARAAIGLARSVLSTEQVGLTAKRHMLGDPYAPATLADVVRAGLYRVALFYAAGGIVVVTLARHRLRARVLALLVITAVPVLAFAIAWQGGDLERYLALFPALFFAVGAALSALPQRRGVLCTAVVIVVLGAFNLRDFSRGAAARACATLATRLRSVPAAASGPTLLVTLRSDELTAMRGRCPDAPVLHQPNLPSVLDLFSPHVAGGDQWRRLFADRALRTWRDGGRVWVSARLLDPRPPAEWHWAEGDDPQVHWRDFPAFFNRLALGELGSGKNSFVEVVASPANVAALDSLPRAAP